jgi:hydrogenase maturation protease|tara:strand:+ start:19039 stop:19509 length:471 start_codon:yes stop_codon:yes gene_type:complete
VSEILILGIGSPHGADRLGWDCIDELRNLAQRWPGRIALEKCDTPANIPNHISDCAFAILVDAIQGDFPYGTVLRLNEEELPEVVSRMSSHGVGVCDGIRLAATLSMKPDNLVLFGIDINEKTEDSIPYYNRSQLLNAIKHEVSRWFSRHRRPRSA